MPYCVIKKCRNTSGNVKPNSGLSFHRFPRDPILKEKWVRVVRKNRNNEDWSPSPFCIICSAHFENNNIYTTKTGLKRIRKSAIPTRNLETENLIKIENVKEEIDPMADLNNSVPAESSSTSSKMSIVLIEEKNTSDSENDSLYLKDGIINHDNDSMDQKDDDNSIDQKDDSVNQDNDSTNQGNDSMGQKDDFIKEANDSTNQKDDSKVQKVYTIDHDTQKRMIILKVGESDPKEQSFESKLSTYPLSEFFIHQSKPDSTEDDNLDDVGEIDMDYVCKTPLEIKLNQLLTKQKFLTNTNKRKVKRLQQRVRRLEERNKKLINRLKELGVKKTESSNLETSKGK